MSQDDQVKKTNQEENSVPPYMHCKDNYRAWRRECRHRDPWHSVIWGSVIILLGVGFLASTMFNFNFAMWWPLILIALGISIMSRSFYRRQ
jgi:hypothetical protein